MGDDGSPVENLYGLYGDEGRMQNGMNGSMNG
jgi:hypothetical protein